MGSRSNRSYESYATYIETRPAQVVANILICLIHQANYLLDQQLRQLEKAFLEEGGLRERMKEFAISAGGSGAAAGIFEVIKLLVGA